MQKVNAVKDDDIDIAVIQGDWGGGGADYVTNKIAEALNADIFYGIETSDNSKLKDSAKKIFKDKFLDSSEYYRYLRYLWSGTRIEELYEYDIIVQSKNQISWYVPKDDQTIVRYSHTTPRTPYDLHYKRGDKATTKLYSLITRVVYAHTTNYPTLWLCNSDIVKKRIQKYLGVDEQNITVVYPPIVTEEWDVEPEKENDLYVTWSRLDESKRISTIVKAFQDLDKKLIIMGDGEQKDTIKKLCKGYDNIIFRGYTDKEELVRTVAKAKATIYNPVNEDFGLIPIESAAAGTPCLTVNDGFSKYQVKDGINGYTHDGTVDGIQESIDKIETNGIEYERSELKDWASQFDTDRFENQIVKQVNRAWNKDRIETKINWI